MAWNLGGCEFESCPRQLQYLFFKHCLFLDRLALLHTQSYYALTHLNFYLKPLKIHTYTGSGPAYKITNIMINLVAPHMLQYRIFPFERRDPLVTPYAKHAQLVRCACVCVIVM